MGGTWAGMGGMLRQPQNCRWNAKSKLIFCSLTRFGKSEAGCGHRHTSRMQAPRSMPQITQPAVSSCVSGIHRRVIYHCTLILPTAWGTGSTRQEPQACSTRYLYVYHRPMLCKHRCCTCQICKTKQHLVWCMRFSTPQLQVTWVCLSSSLSIFCYFPRGGNLFNCMVKWHCQTLQNKQGLNSYYLCQGRTQSYSTSEEAGHKHPGCSVIPKLHHECCHPETVG